MDDRPRILLLGAGGHGKAVIDLLLAGGAWQPAAVVDAAPRHASVLGIPVAGDETRLPGLRAAGIAAAHPAIGNNAQRLAAAARLEQAEAMVRRGAVRDGWRLLQELRAADPQQALLEQYQKAWALYGPVARLEETARVRPNDPGAHAALAQALLDAGLPRRAATEFQALSVLRPDQPDWPQAAARALADSGKLDDAATVLRAARQRCSSASRVA